MEETLTVIRLGINGRLRRTLESTNPAESMIDTVRTTQRNVKHWTSGEMGLRWTAAGMLEAERAFRRIQGHADLAELAIEIERQVTHDITTDQPPLTSTPAKEQATIATT
jgi:hypothetical protein